MVIPPGIQNSDAQALGITFVPDNITVVLGVNSTIVFYNNDTQEHIIGSTAWPSTVKFGFDFYSLPGRINTLVMNATGTYVYNCEWHPLWMTGKITVVAP
ncbi:MAG: hypothetical protein OK456_05850 [Thaumarchaeota archaeon]|nr:hypothetical protein [Nitrososphaerota archaeon]